MKAKGRTLRVGTLIKEEIAKLITKGLKDPRIGFVSIMDVRMSADLRYANVYVSLFGSESERKSSLVGLQNSAGWIRHEVGKFLHMRVLPEIRFFSDDTLDKVYHLEDVFEEIHAEQRQQPMLKLSLEEAVAALRTGTRFYIVSHVNPDGDAIGSMLALRLLLQHFGVTEIVCALDGKVPDSFSELPGVKSIVNADVAPEEYDVAILVDCGQLSRIGALADHIPAGKRILIFDHHREDGEPGTSGIIDIEYAAAGELIAALYEEAEVPWTPESAACIYTAVATDTGCFRFSNTTSQTHRLAAELIESGIDVGRLNQQLFSNMSGQHFEVMRHVLSRVELHFNGSVALSWIDNADLEQLGARREDTENLINIWQSINKVQVAIFFKSFYPGKISVSFRSNNSFDSAAFLRSFGGGGHACAAGATLEMSMEEARDEILSALAHHEQFQQ
ncbi:MAG: 30S ribosome-binding factor RbfA [Candidatus Hydrogenedentales bacterium]|jgi:phosphoesterase RecJ-like protein